MSELPLEFLTVCADYAVLKNLTNVIHKLGGHLQCVSSVIAATEHLERRKVDGVVVDAALDGAFQLIQFIRDGSSNRQSVVFICVNQRKDRSSPLIAGANVVFCKPLVETTILPFLQAVAPMMEAERRRYFGFEVAALVSLSLSGTEHKAVLSNLSETGMAIRSRQVFLPNTSVDFAFELPRGPQIKGHGEVTWSNKAGGVGIRFRFLSEAGHRQLPQWLDRFGTHSLEHNPKHGISSKNANKQTH